MEGLSLLKNCPEEFKRGKCTKTFTYGTAGFRENADCLSNVMFRMGVLAALRSLSTNRKAIGVMITASHNPVQDNGVKLIDPHGEMLDSSWESTATLLVNASDDQFDDVIGKICIDKSIDKKCLQGAVVHCAYDTRPSSLEFQACVQNGVHIFPESYFTTHGLLTTPQLHYIVKSVNSQEIYGIPNEAGYYAKFSSAFNTIASGENNCKVGIDQYQSIIYVDAANGIGGRNFGKLIEKLYPNFLNVKLVNVDSEPLNENCGADYVKTDRKFPKIYTPNVEILPGQKWCSFDGDADRLVYFHKSDNGSFNLLDGDKIAVLMTNFVNDLLSTLLDARVTVGVIQTAYANGSSTKFIEKHYPHVSVYCVPTGVKYLHKKAETLDIGIYFEANGHGTILFSDKLKEILNNLSTGPDSQVSAAALKFLAFINLINEAIGDAMADLLAVETILRCQNWTLQKWDSLYTDIPSKQMKVKVSDRQIIETTNAERTCTKPEGLQQLIDNAVVMFKDSRAFIRPSGTEDIVRVYAEADTEENVEKLARLICGLVYDMANGVGQRP